LGQSGFPNAFEDHVHLISAEGTLLLKAIGPFPYLRVPPRTYEKGGTYDCEQVYPKIAEAERAFCQ
jgi:hypothetical protein